MIPERFAESTLFWARISKVRATADGLISPTPCYLFAAVISSDGQGAADADVHDGHGTTSRFQLDLFAADTLSARYRFNPPLFFSRGLYLDVGSNVESVVLHFLPAAG